MSLFRSVVHSNRITPSAVKKEGTAQVYVVQQSGLMGFFPVNALICGAERTDAVFDVLDKPVRDPTLLFTRAQAYRALNTALRHLFVFFTYSCHINPSSPPFRPHNQ